MKSFIKIFILISVLSSCSYYKGYKGHNRADKMTVKLKGGTYIKSQWSDTLEFKRTSFYSGAKLNHDVIITKLDKTSPFYDWMGEDKRMLSECSEVFVALFYKDMNAFRAVPISYIRDQIIDIGFQEVVIQNFAYHLRQHYAFEQWVLNDHKIYGYCNRSGIKTKKIHLNMPGFKRVNLLK